MHMAKEFLTDRLIIRKPILGDAENVFEKYAQSNDVTKYLTWRPHTDINVTRLFINWCIAQWETGECFPYSICLKETNELIGMLDARIEAFKANCGYVLAKDYWKNGFMAEALNSVINELFNNENIFRIWAVCDIENYGSKRVMEKVGMGYEGVLRKWIMHPNVSQEPRDCFVYAIIKDK